MRAIRELLLPMKRGKERERERERERDYQTTDIAVVVVVVVVEVAVHHPIVSLPTQVVLLLLLVHR